MEISTKENGKKIIGMVLVHFGGKWNGYVGHYKNDVEYGEGMYKKTKNTFMKEILKECL